MWLTAIGLTLGLLSLLPWSRGRGRAGGGDLGWMSHQWLAEYRAGSR